MKNINTTLVTEQSYPPSEPMTQHRKDMPQSGHNNNCHTPISLKALCTNLSISPATGRNWIKLGKITPQYFEKNTPYFSAEYMEQLKRELQSGENTALKSRRNKKFVSGNALYSSYVSEQSRNLPILRELLAVISENDIELKSSTIRLLIADCALHLFADKNGLHFRENENLLLLFLQQKLSFGEYDELINELLLYEAAHNNAGSMNNNIASTSSNTTPLDNTPSLVEIMITEAGITASEITSFCHAHPRLFNFQYIYEKAEDILGLLYISCKNIGNRKAAGSYYTPTTIVKRLIGRLDLKPNDRVLDPACGTGSFLLQLPDDVQFSSIYGNDLDEISVKITRLNMALRFDANVPVIRQHITQSDYLIRYNSDNTIKFNYIIGNPPWGCDFSDEEKKELRTLFKSASGKNIESYDVFIEQALTQLADGGHLAFVLPEALLNVKAHTEIRKAILQTASIRHLDFLGNVFDGVQCPCIILDMECTHSRLTTSGMTVNADGNEFTIRTERDITPECFSFTTTDEQFNILQKIKGTKNTAFLRGNADFALGIVTGDNKKYISDTKTSSNEMVLKGSDISSYHINPSGSYITFKPECFQQVAPLQMYRAPEKLLYRFISSRLIFAYDDGQALSLNSCNIVIPRIPTVPIKYVLAILNSRVAQFIYKKEFNSIKVLRTHLESIPIPPADNDTYNRVISITDKLIAGLSIPEAEEAYEELDRIIMNLFGLNDTEIAIIKSAID